MLIVTLPAGYNIPLSLLRLHLDRITVPAMQEVNKLLEEKFKTGKNRWFFQKLRF